MQAIILAGGRGTRLIPYTAVLPKPLVPIGERPIVDIIIRQLAHHGFKEVCLLTGHLAELIQAYFSAIRSQLPDISISYSRESVPLGTAGALGSLSWLKDTFLVMNGDILTTLNYGKLIDYHRENEGVLTIATYLKKVKIDLGVLEAGEDNVVFGYLEKPEFQHRVSMGVYVFEPTVLDYIGSNEHLDFPDLVLRLIRAGEKVMSCPCDDEYWLDIGRPEDYARAQQEADRLLSEILPE